MTQDVAATQKIIKGLGSGVIIGPEGIARHNAWCDPQLSVRLSYAPQMGSIFIPKFIQRKVTARVGLGNKWGRR